MNLLKPLLLLALLCPVVSFAQSNYKPGYAVTLNGDTLKGLINPKDLQGNPKSITFKTTSAVSPVILTPKNVKRIVVGGKHIYERYAGPITLDNISENWISNSRDTSVRIDTVFLKVLAKGPNVSLYSYGDAVKDRFYITENDSEMPVELGYRLYYDSNKVDIYSNHGRTVNENTYMKQLYNIALKHNLANPEMQQLVEWCRYSKGYLLEVVKKLNAN